MVASQFNAYHSLMHIWKWRSETRHPASHDSALRSSHELNKVKGIVFKQVQFCYKDVEAGLACGPDNNTTP